MIHRSGRHENDMTVANSAFRDHVFGQMPDLARWSLLDQDAKSLDSNDAVLTLRLFVSPLSGRICQYF